MGIEVLKKVDYIFWVNDNPVFSVYNNGIVL